MDKGVYRLPELHNVCQCEEYAMCNHERGPFLETKSRRSSSCLQLVHMDICGPMNTSLLGGNKYFLLLVDDYSRKCLVYFLKSEGEAFDHFKRFHTLVEKETGRKL